jgi:hypothetical protein
VSRADYEAMPASLAIRAVHVHVKDKTKRVRHLVIATTLLELGLGSGAGAGAAGAGHGAARQALGGGSERRAGRPRSGERAGVSAVRSDRPFGSSPWTLETARALGLEASLRPRGRPRTVEEVPGDRMT